MTNSPIPFLTAIHAGAHLAQERRRYEEFGLTDVLWIEGAADTHRRLAEIIEAEAVTARAHHRTTCAVLSDRDGLAVQLRSFDNDGKSNSIFSFSAKGRQRFGSVREVGKQEVVLTRTLDSVASQFGIADSVDLLVVDVQGAELLVLTGAERVLRSARAVIAEVSKTPFFEGGVLFPELNRFLAAHGFIPAAVPPRHGDLLFIRADNAPARPRSSMPTRAGGAAAS